MSGRKKIASCTPNFYRFNITKRNMLAEMRGRGWLSLTQVVACFGKEIPPEVGMRYFGLHYDDSTSILSAAEKCLRGKRSVINTRMNQFVRQGAIERRRGKNGKEPEYRIVLEEIDDGPDKISCNTKPTS